MLEHLDDPTPPEITARQLAAVLSRSAAHRRRRSRVLFGMLGACILVAGIAIGLAVPRGATSLTVTNLALHEDDLVPGIAVPALHLAGAVFPDDQHGFAMTTGSSKSALVETSDGGQSWIVIDGHLPLNSYYAQLDFTSTTNGYLWGGSSSGRTTLPLWVTVDGGRSWARAPIGPVVSDVSAIGANVWAVVGGCTGATGGTCPVSLEESTDGGITWSPSPVAPPVLEASLPSYNDQNIELARMTLEHAYLLTYGADDQSGQLGRIVYTADGGTSWTTVDDPCPSVASSSEIAGSGTDDLWLLCAGEPAAGDQLKALYRSEDGGATWALVSSATGNTPAIGFPQIGNLPENGYVVPVSLGHENLAVISPTEAWLIPERGPLYETRNGGSTWRAVNLPGFYADGYASVVFSDATHGWVDDPSAGVWRTTNAVNWQTVDP